jgi:hypothetical protein
MRVLLWATESLPPRVRCRVLGQVIPLLPDSDRETITRHILELIDVGDPELVSVVAPAMAETVRADLIRSSVQPLLDRAPDLDGVLGRAISAVEHLGKYLDAEEVETLCHPALDMISQWSDPVERIPALMAMVVHLESAWLEELLHAVRDDPSTPYWERRAENLKRLNASICRLAPEEGRRLLGNVLHDLGYEERSDFFAELAALMPAFSGVCGAEAVSGIADAIIAVTEWFP